MKIGTFVMGGLAGAALVMMIQRNQMMSAVASSMGQSMKHRAGNMKNELIGRAMTKFGGMSFASSKHSDSRHSRDESGSGDAFRSEDDGLGKIGQLASQDPEVSKEINAILEQNGQDRI